MPTGYTAEVMEKDVSFKTFALRCARAFEALIELRDEGLDAPIPKKFKPSPYYSETLQKSKGEYSHLKIMNKKEREAYGEFAKTRAIQASNSYLQEAKAQNARLDAMLEQVEKWQPPSPQHTEMKRFMREQPTISRNDLSYSLKSMEAAEKKAPLAYYEEALETALRNISYYKKEMKKEKERIVGRNKWVKQLRESLP